MADDSKQPNLDEMAATIGIPIQPGTYRRGQILEFRDGMLRPLPDDCPPQNPKENS